MILKRGPRSASQTGSVNTNGFSIPEVLIAMGLVGFFVMTLYGGFVYSYSSVQAAREHLRATQIISEKMETLRLYTWDQINSNGFIPGTFTATYDPLGSNSSQGLTYQGTFTLSNPAVSANYSNELKQVTIRLDWISGTRNRSEEFSTFVTRQGLQGYVY